MTSISAYLNTVSVSHTKTTLVTPTTNLGFKIATTSSSKLSILKTSSSTSNVSKVSKLMTSSIPIGSTSRYSSSKQYSSVFAKGSSIENLKSSSARVGSVQRSTGMPTTKVVWVIETSTKNNVMSLTTSQAPWKGPNGYQPTSTKSRFTKLASTTLPAVYYYAGNDLTNSTLFKGNRTTTASPLSTQTSSNPPLKITVFLFLLFML